MKKTLLVSIALVVMYVVGTFAAGTTVNGTRTINGDLTVKGTCTGCGGGGALVLVEQHTASSSASLDFTTCISSTYDDYLLEFINLIPATDGAILGWQASTDGGSTYDTGTNYRYNNVVGGGGLGLESTSTATSIVVTYTGTGQDNSSTYGVNGNLRLQSALSTSVYKRLIGYVTYLGNDNILQNYFVNGAYQSTTASNAFRLLYSSGNIASGTVRCYGVAKS